MKTTTTILVAVLGAAVGAATAQQADTGPGTGALKRNIEIFTGVLEEALELNQEAGVFGLSLGGVDDVYLAGHGVVFQVRTPLANQRNLVSLASLNSTMRSLSESRNPFEAVQRQSAAGATQRLPLAVGGSETEGRYPGLMDRIARVDYSLLVNTAIQQVAESARSLRRMDSIDEDAYGVLREEIDGWREDLQGALEELGLLEQRLRVDNARNQDAASADDGKDLATQLDELLKRIDSLQEQTLARAAELKQRHEIAEQEYRVRWQEDLAALETSIYTTLCDYGSALRELPAEETVSIVLTGLGEETDDAGPHGRDKIHILGKTDVLRCLGGEIDVVALQRLSTQYSY